MSLFSRIFRKSSPAPTAAPASPSAPPARQTGPDPAAVAAADAAALAAAIATRDEVALARLALEGSSTGVRQRAAEAIEDPARVRDLIRQVRGGKDKSVYRILVDKRDADLARQRAADQIRAEVEAAAEAIERHSHRSWDALFVPALEQFEKRWQALEDNADAAARVRVDAALERARAVVRQRAEQRAAEAARQQAAAESAAEARRQRELEAAAAAAAAATDAATAAERATQLAAERQAALARQEAEAAVIRGATRLLRGAQAALEEGNTARAARLRRELELRVAEAPPLPAWFPRQLQALDARLEEMKDWKTFSIAPKREELLQEIESLVGSTLDPPLLANQIRELQQQWRTIERGAGDDLAADRERFREAATRAWEPCRLYFAAQAQERAANLERREDLIQRLDAFAAGQREQGPDWRRVMQVLAEARREWRACAPVDRAAAKPSHARFDAILDSLQADLRAEFARNVEAKRALTARAATLLAMPDTRQAIEEMKALQRSWKTIGIVPRDQEEPLWEAFRQQCDAVFARREQESAAYTAGLEANRTQALELCAELERIGGLEGEELLAAGRQLEEIRDRFEGLELPRQGARELRQRFDAGFDGVVNAVAGQRDRDARRVWSDVFEVGNRVRALALAVLGGHADSEVTEARRLADEAIAGVRQWPKGARAVIDRQLASVAAGTVVADLAANEAALRTLCVRAEILANLPTPDEDQTLRRELQMQQLLRSMGQGRRHEAGTLDALFLEWIAIGPLAEDAYRRLLGRLEECRRRKGEAGGPVS